MKFLIPLSFVSIILSGLTHVSADPILRPSRRAGGGGNRGGDPQKSLSKLGCNCKSCAKLLPALDPAVIASGFANNGQDVPTAGRT